MQPQREKEKIQGFGIIRQKLETFIRRYYVNELIKGALLFTAIGLLYLIFTLLVEHFLWLGRGGRAVLFWLFFGVAVFLLYRFIAVPLFKLFRIQKGISHEEASRIIGNHFPEVGDKLLNVLQLSGNSSEENKNELLVASIEQKSAELQPFPFHIAVDIKKNLHYAKYALIPIVIILLVWVSGNINWFSDSYNRVVHYQSAFEPPAPFQFFVVNNTLSAIEGKPFEIQVRTTGDVVPEDVEIHYGEETYFMQKEGPGNFNYVFKRPDKSVDFYLSANDVQSRPYRLEIVNAPAMTGFEMYLNYPAYLKMSPDTLTGTGNATVPEGTKITWKLNTENAEKVNWISKDSAASFKEISRNGKEAGFEWSARVYRDTDYEISTGSTDLPDYESLGFGIVVIKDEYPEIEVKEVRDSLSVSSTNFAGQISDDNGFYGLKMVYYPENKEEQRSEKKININTSGNVDRFIDIFPGKLSLEEGLSYTVFFEVTDNDALRGGKSARSGLFTYRVRTGEEIEREQLQQQKGAIRSLERSLGNMEEQRRELNQINTLNMEKEEKTFNDRQKIDNFLERQLQQEKTMQKFTKELSDHLKKSPGDKEDEAQKKLLEERLERQKEEIDKNEKLLEELKELTDKLKREDMAKRLEKLSKSQQNNKRNLEQVLELTKRYYVTQKAEKLSREMEKLGEEQEKLSGEKSENSSEKQEELNEKFDQLKKESEELEKENSELKKPMELGRDEKKEQSVSEEQQKALENLQNENTEKAKQQQRNAGQKMKQMAGKMKSAMQSGSASDDMEDATVLRQILKNVVAFSFEQEDLMKKVNEMREDHPSYSVTIRKQHDLKEAFEHIDDSIFALSLRRPELSEMVNKEITDAHFHIDKAIERLSENEVYRGASSQQYAFTAANNLAALLGNILDNLQQNMGMGKGDGENEIQLPDIIQSQEQLNQQMKDAMENTEKKGEEGKKNEDEKTNEKDGEGQSEELYEIYKQQQMLRQAIEKQLSDKSGDGNRGKKDKLLKEMEQVEDELLRDGFNESTLKKMLNLRHELLKLQDAAMEQGEENRRESHTNEKGFQGKQGELNPELEEYLRGIEILNRQVLPLRQIYKKKVKEYFKKDD
ncbi:DUF4175 family protein [Sinomicrobium weinanense]|uniref:DUF4175 family protein n=1 Tax=Sinomicrobium weinanense TaxID=2842200 RepID=A0A926JU42_9FLAO|nr:DUF4175 family protein [Sinomicrobium weinanense]MBC9797283.1 hypothetical protein [Sinomicrobium weinanense]MBU3125416.1 hypothetical protein [Sinomicrobium weinanense]